ncbi:hypothetical protein PF005_g8108 [Phytophthora fragariae]|uniref:Uncharacterized protein n=1 Tax=Phytophthora fragariae TaxID=53985 RepID=A0A6A3YIB8_9STRA|nr:hypothetical protein PF011_g6398 [Phytophthora fragariae]KAE9218832.1 hypothetical protein PF005_g8108 [Phytophthora fragariae]KAE9242760.1 hypothetical protein PF004_g6471 [Phytophthora fragariae]KAE9243472.1 hypothetical protein PF002_g8246 [Phytophthora fragariae]
MFGIVTGTLKEIVVDSDDSTVELGADRLVVSVGGTVRTVVWLVTCIKKQLRTELQLLKHLHRSSEDSDDTCITVLSSDGDEESVAASLMPSYIFDVLQD